METKIQINRPRKRTTINRVVTSLTEDKLRELTQLVQNCTGACVGEDCNAINVNRSTHLSVNSKGYVQIKVKTPNDKGDTSSPNLKVQLHQLLAWTHPDEDMRVHLRAAIETKTMEISHLCGNKRCTTPSHLCAEDSWANKTRITCEVAIYVDGVEYQICRHEPRCILTTDKRRQALRLKMRNAKAE